MVVDECDSTMGCDDEHDYQPPCPNNIVDASRAVWEALGVPEGDWGELDITWSDAQSSFSLYMYIYQEIGKRIVRFMVSRTINYTVNAL